MTDTVKIDVLLVSGARPSLLEKTLASFSKRLFKNFEIGALYVNIDPFEGGPVEVDACETICKRHFTNVVARKPEASHFTRAIRWLWRQPAAHWCLHLEDDWMLNRDVHPEEVKRAMTRNVRQVSLMTREKNWGYRSLYHFEPGRKTFLGMDLGKGLNTKRPIFGTSPSFLRSDFAARCAELMDEKLDPEKQLNYMNPDLNAYTAQFRNRFIGARRDYVAVDIGREHRDALGITKEVIDGNSVWSRTE
ncbi:hypothetical protein FMN63_00805 [Stappia sp. BW2]|uniref:hypothetical protein n=1 Tax=Stappia sp. BW2 TaxID=2592622 RepID=UPI0011DEC83C|nr:hypothetical protein [Stappia sp. BW2]TYC79822.1 hypothetical protein FMN63_00805 [Stappia sp. BW2]